MRHHIHVIAVNHHQPIFFSELMMFLQHKALTTHDLPIINTQTTTYSRQCIDACDMAIMIVADSYGDTNASGVSQLHLSYLSAKTKHKPLLILMKSPSSAPRTRQLNDFINLVEQRGPQQLYYYQDETNFVSVLTEAYDILLQTAPMPSWAKAEPKPSHTSVDLGVGLSQQRWQVEAQPPSAVMTNSAVIRNKRQEMLAQSALGELERLNTVMELQDISTEKQVENSMIDKGYFYDESAQDGFNTEQPSLKDGGLSQIISELSSAVSVVTPDDTTVLHYEAHAYQHGNLQDVSLTATLSWQMILQAMTVLTEPFSIDAVHRVLNDAVAKQAIDSVVKILPDAHAVSRCQIANSDIQQIKSQLVFNGWIQSAPSPKGLNKPFWQLTKKAIIDGALIK